MKTLTWLLVAVLAGTQAKSVSLLNTVEISDLINNPRYLIFERDDGLFEIEDFETAEFEPVLAVTEDDITFFIYTPDDLTGISLKASQANNITKLTTFSLNRDTVVIIHGWKNSNISAVNKKIRTALFQSRNVNVIVVDWSPIAAKNYISAQASVLAVGNFIGDFLITLNNEVGYSLGRITLVGHSLGAHIAGNTGAKASSQINTIIGLDPAGPLFSSSNIDNRLDPTDGQYVEVIHTNAGILGYAIRMGHVDYYPNGGTIQPGCGVDIGGSCAHSRSYAYYAESVNNNKFLSRLCSNYLQFLTGACEGNTEILLGAYPVTRATEGQYFLRTNSNSPFAKG
ncbi:hypothetical protein ABEB36_011189 [Hypothenemus hampei]|uniref:Lipase domain-containing protein n=1 Tax=Hypothenemus hampei TaxID=57062 RepID=A0ABD1EEI1_HYPHA